MSLKCFVCGGDLNEERTCRSCGAAMQVSQVSGNIIWVRSGRVVAAFQDTKDAWVKMAKRCGIPEAEWPAQFREPA
jgi:hypothetical protein